MRLIPPPFTLFSLPPSITLLALLAATTLSACSPAFNWREVRMAEGDLIVLLPCKPDQGTRPVEMGLTRVDLHMQGCEAGSGASAAMFTVATFTAPPVATGEAPAPLQDLWQAAAQATLRIKEPKVTIAQVTRAFTAIKTEAVKTEGRGQRADGKAVESQAMYFRQGQQLYQAAILADHIQPEIAETFFAGLKLQ